MVSYAIVVVRDERASAVLQDIVDVDEFLGDLTARSEGLVQDVRRLPWAWDISQDTVPCARRGLPKEIGQEEAFRMVFRLSLETAREARHASTCLEEFS
jgi:hypothetical protein